MNFLCKVQKRVLFILELSPNHKLLIYIYLDNVLIIRKELLLIMKEVLQDFMELILR